MREKVVLAYSGGLDTSIIIPWLKENYDYDVIAYVADVGQGDDIDAVVEKAYKTGASKVIVDDLRQEFLTDYVFPAIQAGAVYEHKYLLGTSLARPIIAKYQVLTALKEGATALAHGCTGKGNDQVRFEHAFQALAPELKVIAPWREWNLVSREDCLDYAEAHGIPVAASREKIHSRDRNLLHVSHEGGELEDPNNAPLATTWTWTNSPQEAPDAAEKVSIEFAQGVPVAVNGEAMDPIAIVEALNEIGARNAIGRIDLVENRFVGMKSRGCYETPGGTLLLTAHRELEALCLDRELMHFKQHIGLKYAEVVYFGLWFTPLRESLQAFVASSQDDVNGTVTLSLYKGNIDVAGRKSESSLYRPDVASFTMGASYNQKDAEGFIRILGLPARSRALVKSGVPKFGVESAGIEDAGGFESAVAQFGVKKSGVKK
jgi:argininosuccinate synthase